MITRAIQLMGILFFITLLGFTQRSSIELEGKAVDAATGLPVTSVYLYTVEGEEEALTGKDGKFKFTTWKSPPFLITAEHSQYEKQVIRITTPPKQLEIKLKKNN